MKTFKAQYGERREGRGEKGGGEGERIISTQQNHILEKEHMAQGAGK